MYGGKAKRRRTRRKEKREEKKREKRRTWLSNIRFPLFLLAERSFSLLFDPRGLCMYTSALAAPMSTAAIAVNLGCIYQREKKGIRKVERTGQPKQLLRFRGEQKGIVARELERKRVNPKREEEHTLFITTDDVFLEKLIKFAKNEATTRRRNRGEAKERMEFLQHNQQHPSMMLAPQTYVQQQMLAMMNLEYVSYVTTDIPHHDPFTQHHHQPHPPPPSPLSPPPLTLTLTP